MNRYRRFENLPWWVKIPYGLFMAAVGLAVCWAFLLPACWLFDLLGFPK